MGTGASALIIYISIIQRTEKYSAVMYLSNPVLLVVVIDHLPPSNNHHHLFRSNSDNFEVDSRLAASPPSPSSSSSTSPGSLSRTSSLTDMSGTCSLPTWWSSGPAMA